MKAFWRKYADRIDAMTLRERAIVFGGVATLLLVFAYVFFIETEFDKSRRLGREIAQRQGELKALQEQIGKMARMRGDDPDRENRERLARAREQLAAVDGRIQAEERKFTAPAQMRGIVEELVARNKRVRLIDLKTIPATSIAEARQAEAASPAGGAKPAPAAERLIFRHGLELGVAGSYLDLLGYLQDLERLPTQLYWGNLEIDAAAYPRLKLRLVVYTLSIDPAWMSV